MKFLITSILLGVSIVCMGFITKTTTVQKINPKMQLSETEKSIICDDKKPRLVRVTPGRLTVLNFPFKPKEVVPGSQAFDFKQIKNDLVIMAARGSGQTNIVVYLEERRCSFNLITVKSGGDDILIVKDMKDSQYEVRF